MHDPTRERYCRRRDSNESSLEAIFAGPSLNSSRQGSGDDDDDDDRDVDDWRSEEVVEDDEEEMGSIEGERAGESEAEKVGDDNDAAEVVGDSNAGCVAPTPAPAAEAAAEAEYCEMMLRSSLANRSLEEGASQSISTSICSNRSTIAVRMRSRNDVAYSETRSRFFTYSFCNVRLVRLCGNRSKRRLNTAVLAKGTSLRRSSRALCTAS